jgi:hypothetical protein
MNRIAKATSTLLKILTIPARVTVGLIKAVQKEMPDQIKMPYEIRKKPTEESNTKLVFSLFHKAS